MSIGISFLRPHLGGSRDGWVADSDTGECILTLSAAGYPEWIPIPAARWMGRRHLHVQWVMPGHYTFEAITTVEPRIFSTELQKIFNVRLSWQWSRSPITVSATSDCLIGRMTNGYSLAVLRAQARARLKPLGQ